MNSFRIYLFLCAFLPLNILAHEEQSTLPQKALSASASLTYRDQSAVDTGEAWVVPGALLGGEAVPEDKGLNLDDLQLQASYNIDDNYSFSAKLSVHSHSGENNLELENAWFSWDASKILKGGVVELGRLSTSVSNTAMFHGSQSAFSEAPLLSDVFFGRHFNDMGAKIKATRSFLSYGLEGWTGDAWPAASNDGAASTFIKMHPTWRNGGLNIDAWYMYSNASNRSDDRYGTEHNHGGITVESPAAGIYFNGSTKMAGLFLAAHHFVGDMRFLLEAEWIQSQSEGELNDDSNQQSTYESTYDGTRALLGLSYKLHQLSIQYEELTLQNIFLDSINIVFLEETGLQAQGFNPNKLMASWRWQFHPDFQLRAEWIEDKSSSDTGLGRSALGLVWQKKLF